jgi:hypothetical protein
MKRFSLWRLGALAGVMLCIGTLASRADDYDKKTIVTISERTEVPGIILEPGTYVIKLLNSSSNRHIAEIMNEKMDHLYALTFTVAAEKIQRTGKTVLTFYEGSNNRPPALRKWFWPGDTIGQEFIYPKDQAARISAATKERVPEGKLPTLAESGQTLVADNAKGLSSQASEQRDVSEKAEVSLNRDVDDDHKETKAAEPERAPEPVVIAQNTAPPPAPVEETRQSEPIAAPVTAPVQESAASNNSAQSLPETASPLSLIGLVGLVSLALGGFVALLRRFA